MERGVFEHQGVFGNSRAAQTGIHHVENHRHQKSSEQTPIPLSCYRALAREADYAIALRPVRPEKPPDPLHHPHLVDALGGRHGSLDGQATDVLPALLQQRDEVVDGQHDVGDQLLVGHADVADGDTHAQNLLELELDSRLDLVDLAGEVVGVRDGCGELAGCGPLALAAPASKRRAGIPKTYPWTDQDPADGGSA